MSDLEKKNNVDQVDIEEEEEESIAEERQIIVIPFKKCKELFFTLEDPPKRPKRKFFFWYPPGQTSAEKKLVFKLDVTIMTYVCLSYFIRYLDANNITTAYVTGMKEDLDISGKEYVWLTQLFNAAYCFAGFFTTIILTRVRFSRMLPLLEVIWGLLTLFIYKAQSFETVAILRTFQGLCEGAAWPAIHYILGSWYKNGELAKRTSIFASSGYVGVILSGLIQSGLQSSMDGVHGLAGWRWVFIIDACITFPVAIIGLFVPDSPENTKKKFYLSDEELELARTRILVNGKKRVDRLDIATFKRVYTCWQLYVFVISWIIWGFSGYFTNYMGITLLGLGYDEYQRNNIPTGISGVGIVATLLSGFIVDYIGRRIDLALIMTGIWVVGIAIIKAWDVPRGALIFGYMLTGMYYSVSPIIVGWCNELSKGDNQKRAVTIGSLNLFSGFLGIPYSLEYFDTDLGPQFKDGGTASLVCIILLFLYMLVILAFDRYENRKREYLRIKNEELDLAHAGDIVVLNDDKLEPVISVRQSAEDSDPIISRTESKELSTTIKV